MTAYDWNNNFPPINTHSTLMFPPRPVAGGREVLLALVDDLRADVAKAMSADQARAAWFRERDIPRSKRIKAIYERRGHGYAAILAVAAQIEARADRFSPVTPPVWGDAS